MGRHSKMFSCQLPDVAWVRDGHRVLDVGCGTGALTSELVARLGPTAVAAVDPSEPFVAATREHHPGVDVRRSPAEQLQFADAAFDAALAQLVVHFMKEPVAGLAEMRRVTRRDGMVAACVWKHGGGEGPLAIFSDAARTLDAEIDDEYQLPGVRLSASAGKPAATPRAHVGRLHGSESFGSNVEAHDSPRPSPPLG